MARKHFDEYLTQIKDQYDELLRNLNEVSSYVGENAVDDDYINNIKETIKPIADSYNSLLYIKYLLDMPKRKEKKVAYERQQNKLLSSIPQKNKAGGVKQNNEILLKNLKKSIKND